MHRCDCCCFIHWLWHYSLPRPNKLVISNIKAAQIEIGKKKKNHGEEISISGHNESVSASLTLRVRHQTNSTWQPKEKQQQCNWASKCVQIIIRVGLHVKKHKIFFLVLVKNKRRYSVDSHPRGLVLIFLLMQNKFHNKSSVSNFLTVTDWCWSWLNPVFITVYMYINPVNVCPSLFMIESYTKLTIKKWPE